MKSHVVGAVLVAWLAMSPPVYAGVTDWPIIGQLAKVGICILEDAGKLGEIVVRHAAQTGTEVLTTVKDCLTFVLDAVTPGDLTPAPEGTPTTEEPHV